MAGIDLYAVRELEQPLQAQEHPARALVGLGGKVGTGGVADEQRVARDQEPGLVAARAVDDGEAAVLRPVARRVQNANRHLAELELLPVRERVVLELGSCLGMHGDRQVVLQCQPAVARNVIRMGVRLEDAHQARLLLLRFGEVLLDRVGRVDDDRRPRGLVADQVGRAAEIVVDELAEEHVRNLTGPSSVSCYRQKSCGDCWASGSRWRRWRPLLRSKPGARRSSPFPRATADRSDDYAGLQLRAIYATPTDGPDRGFDTSGGHRELDRELSVVVDGPDRGASAPVRHLPGLGRRHLRASARTRTRSTRLVAGMRATCWSRTCAPQASSRRGRSTRSTSTSRTVRSAAERLGRPLSPAPSSPSTCEA